MILNWTNYEPLDFGYALEQLSWCCLGGSAGAEAICVVHCTPTEPHAWDDIEGQGLEIVHLRLFSLWSSVALRGFRKKSGTFLGGSLEGQMSSSWAVPPRPWLVWSCNALQMRPGGPDLDCLVYPGIRSWSPFEIQGFQTIPPVCWLKNQRINRQKTWRNEMNKPGRKLRHF